MTSRDRAHLVDPSRVFLVQQVDGFKTDPQATGATASPFVLQSRPRRKSATPKPPSFSSCRASPLQPLHHLQGSPERRARHRTERSAAVLLFSGDHHRLVRNPRSSPLDLASTVTIRSLTERVRTNLVEPSQCLVSRLISTQSDPIQPTRSLHVAQLISVFLFLGRFSSNLGKFISLDLFGQI